MRNKNHLFLTLLVQMLLRWNRHVFGYVSVTHQSFVHIRFLSRRWMPNFPRTRGSLVLHSNHFSSSSKALSNERVRLLHKKLETISIDADELFAAAMNSLEDPTAGYDNRFGKSAIKAFRSFVYPKTMELEEGEEIENGTSHRHHVLLSAAAGRCARQIDFLIKRHRSHQTEWVRHHDTIRSRRNVFPLIVLLDNLRSAYNVGSLYRTADACGCEQVITCGITPNPNGNGSDKIAKSALGADMLVPSKHFPTTLEAIRYLRKEMPAYQIIGLETTDTAKDYTSLDFVDKKIVLVLGNEVTGVDTRIISELDGIVEIPTFGAKNSLNVASCAPVVLYEILRQWGRMS